MNSESHTILDVTGIVAAVRRRIWLVGTITVLVAVIAVAVSFLLSPVYRAQVLLAPASESRANLLGLAGSVPGLAGLVGGDLGEGTDKVQNTAILASRELGERFIRERNLMPVLFADQWDAQAGDWKAEYKETPPTMSKAYALFDDKVRRVAENPRTGLIELTIDWTDPEVAADWANDLVDRMNRRARDQARTEAEKSIEYLGEELKSTNTVDMRTAIYAQIQSHMRDITTANVRDQYAFKVLDRAFVADADQYVFPNKKIFLAVGLFLGGLIGAGIAVLLEMRSPSGSPVSRSSDA